MPRNPLSRLFKRRASHYLNDDGSPRTLAYTSSSEPTGLFATTTRNTSTLDTYWKYYANENTVFAAVNYTAWNTVMSGYDLSGPEDAVKALENFIYETDLDAKLLDMVIHTLVFGDGFLERIYNKTGNKLVNLKLINPKTMVVEYDKYGRVTGYRQNIGGKKGELIDPKYIAHFVLFSQPDSPYGLSLIAPSKDTINRKVRTDEAIARAIIRHGFTRYKVTVGNKDIAEPVPESVLKQIKSDLKDLNEQNEIIIPWTIDIKSLDEKGVQGIEEYFNYFQTQLIIGLLCPEEALGLGKGSTEATAYVKALMYERMIKSFQLRLSRFMEREIFNVFLATNGFPDTKVRVLFRSVTDEDEAMKAKWIGNLLRAYRDEMKPFTINEVRHMFGLPPLTKEEMDELYEEYGRNKKD